MKISQRTVPWLIAMLAALLFLPGLGQVPLFDWDEINFAESAREMLASGEWSIVQINYQPFWEKPPLFIWFQALSMQVLGVGEYAARFPNAIVGILTLITLYFIGRREGSEKLGLFWAMLHGCSILPHLYFRSGIIDPWFNYFIFLGIYFAYRYLQGDGKSGLYWILASATSVGASMLTKGPVGPLIFGLVAVIFLILRSSYWRKVRLGPVAVFLVGFVLIGGAWFLWQILDGRGEVVQDFITYQIRLLQTEDAGHRGFFGYHAVVLLLGVFPASPLALKPLFSRTVESGGKGEWIRLMKITFWVILVLFSIVQTKIIHYSSMAYFPLTFLGALFLEQLSFDKTRVAGWQKGMLIGLGLLFGLVVMVLAWGPELQAYLRDAEWIKDPFARGNLEAAVNWRRVEWLPAIPMLIGVGFLMVGAKGRMVQKLVVLSFGTLLFTAGALALVVPGVEEISQAAAIEFFEDKADEEAYLTTLYYKSYAPYFYGRISPPVEEVPRYAIGLIREVTDRPVYVAAKIQREQRIQQDFPELTLLYRKNGFLFYVKKSVKQTSRDGDNEN